MTEKKKRAPNFSSNEVDILCELIAKYSIIIESKKSDALSWQEKLSCWGKITAEFNYKTGLPPRTIATLRGKYETFKKDLRKKLAKHKQELFKTGGGINEVPSLTPSEEKIYGLISLSVDGLAGRFDDDTLLDTNKKPNKNIKELCSSESDNDMQENNQDCLMDEEELIIIQVNDETFDIHHDMVIPDTNKKEQQHSKSCHDYTIPGSSNSSRSVDKQNDKSRQEQKDTWKDWTPKSLKAATSKCLQAKRKPLTKFQACQKINALAESKKELVNLQIQYLKNEKENQEKMHVIKMKKVEEELKSTQLEVEIKEIEKKIKEETLKKILDRNYSLLNV